jgi:Leucine-rich repeat (LRR) protein
MSVCTLCSRSACRGGARCATSRKLVERKLALLADRETCDYGYSTCVDLTGLHLTSLPKDYFLGLDFVTRVDLSDNDIAYLPWWTFEHINDLQDLILHNNPKLKRLSDALPDTLQRLECKDCPLLGPSDDWLFTYSALPHLLVLRLVNCGFTKLPMFPSRAKTAWRLPRLEVLDLSNNTIRAVNRGALGRMHRLRQLDLAGNRLRAFATAAVVSPRAPLSRVSLASNRLSTVPAALSPTLETLCLEDNRIRDLHPDAFQGLLVLNYVNLARNRIATLPEGLFAVQGAMDVDVTGNKRLQYVDRACFALDTAFVTLCATDCPRLAAAPQDEDDYGTEFLTTLFEAQDTLDRVVARSRFKTFHEEFMAALFHPSRVEKFIAAHGMEALEAF